MSVKRWDSDRDGNMEDADGLDPCGNGEYVIYTDYAALEKLLHDAIDVLRHANKYFPLTSAQIVLVRYRKLYPKGRRTK